MSVHMVLKSTDGVSLLENNAPYDFTVQLSRPINLKGYWVVALTELSIGYRDSSKRIGDIYIFSNICDYSFVGATEKPLLRKVHISKEITEQYMVNKGRHYMVNLMFRTPYYVPVQLGSDPYLYN